MLRFHRRLDCSVRSISRYVVALACIAVAGVGGADESNSTTVDLTPKPNQNLMRVRIEMDVKGNVNVPNNPLVSRKSERALPIQSDAVFDYEERYQRPVDADPRSEVPVVERFYHRAHSSNRLNKSESKLQLRSSVRHVNVHRASLPETIYAAEDYFTSEELSLLRIPVSSAAVDLILPTNPVKVGDTHKPSSQSLISLLNLSSVEATDVELTVASIDDDVVKMHLRGKVDGSAEGVPTVIRTVGKLNFDRNKKTCTWLAIALHETREIGKAEPGFDVAATIRMVRQPLAKVVGLPVKSEKISVDQPIPNDRLFIDLISENVGVGVLMDRRWRVMSDVTGSAMMRMIDNDRSVAQCNLRPLARLKPGEHLTLEAFQQDVRKTLGEQLSDLVEAEQRLSATGLRVLRIVASGVVEDVPIQWIMMHFSDDSGRRVLATFTMSASSVESFAGADVQFADSLRLLNSVANESVDGDAQDGSEKQTSEKPDAEVARRPTATNSDAPSDIEVQSPSDVR